MAKRDASATEKKRTKIGKWDARADIRKAAFAQVDIISLGLVYENQSGDLQMRDSRTRCLYDGQAEVASRLRDPWIDLVTVRYPRDDELQGDIPRRYSIRPHRPLLAATNAPRKNH
jgi:hypothetical protein